MLSRYSLDRVEFWQLLQDGFQKGSIAMRAYGCRGSGVTAKNALGV